MYIPKQGKMEAKTDVVTSWGYYSASTESFETSMVP